MFLSVALKARHASEPSLRTQVFIDREQPGKRRRWERVSFNEHALLVPMPAAWTPDTLRATLDALRRYLPSHDLADALGRVEVHTRKRYCPPQVAIAVRVHHLEATAWIPPLNSAENVVRPFWMNVPMLALLRNLEQRGPFALAALNPVDAELTTATAPAVPPAVDSACDTLRRMIRTFSQNLQPEHRPYVIDAIRDAIADLDEDDE